MQEDEDGAERVIAYSSRTLNRAERNYGVVEKEVLAVVWGMSEQFRSYIHGSFCLVRTDHQPL